MRKFLVLLLILVSVIAEGRKISESEAAAIASEFLNSATVKHPSSKAGVRRVKARDAVNADAAPFYVYNADGNNGFVIVSGDDRATRILGYSDTGSFDYDNLPPQLDDLLKQYAEQLKNIPEATPTHDSWKAPARTSEEGGVLLETANWGQGAPYNSLCPVIDGVQCPAGCVATAMAIVMKYHNWPKCGREKISCEGECVDFSLANYDWDLLSNITPPYTDEQSSELAEITYHAGMSVLTRYNNLNSFAFVSYIAPALNYYFKYDDECQLISKDYHSDDEWWSILKAQIDMSLPVMCGGTSGTSSHAFVCDGYNSKNEFHINWGWDGLNNGYYSSTLLTYSNEKDLYPVQWAVINIKPSSDTQTPSPIWLTDYGLSVDTKNIKQGEVFNTTSMRIRGYSSQIFQGEIGLCLVDANETILEIIATSRVGEGNMGNNDVNIRFKDCKASSEIKSNYRLKLYTRADNESIWKPVHGSIDCPTSIPVENNDLRFTPVEWDLPEHVALQTEYEEYVTGAYWDKTYFVRLHFPIDEMLTLFVNDEIMLPSNFYSEYCPFPRMDYYFYNCLGINIDFNEQYRDHIKFRAVTTAINDLHDAEIALTAHGNAKEALSAYTNPLTIGGLTVKGKISVNDISYILGHYPNIKKLDLSNAILCTSNGVECVTLPHGLFDAILNLEQLNLPANIIEIEDCAIKNCWRLSTIIIPPSVVNVGNHAFDSCFYLHHIYCESEGKVSGLLDAIRNSMVTGDEYWYQPIYGAAYCNLYVLDKNVEQYQTENPHPLSICILSTKNSRVCQRDGLISYNNFGDNIYVKADRAVTFGVNSDSDVISAGNHIKIPSTIDGLGVKYIIARSFNEHKNLQEVILPEGLLEIGESAFEMSGLKTLVLPASMNRIYRYAFSQTSIDWIYVESRIPFILDPEAFSSYDATLYVPVGSKSAYQNAEVWRNFNNIVESDMTDLGDTNGDGSINIADAVNIANYIIDLPTTDFRFVAADANKDGHISVSDVSATITIIQQQSYSLPVSDRRSIKSASIGGSGLLSCFNAGNGEYDFAVDSETELTALQFDVKTGGNCETPEISVAESIAKTHNLTISRVDESTVRVILFSPGSDILPQNQVLLVLNAGQDGAPDCTNIFASDDAGQAKILRYNAEVSGLSDITTDNMCVEGLAGQIAVSNASGREITVTDTLGKIIFHATASDDITYVRANSGIYIVRVGVKSFKVFVK